MIPEAPNLIGSFTATIDDSDGVRVVGLILMEVIPGVPISAPPTIPESMFVAMMVADIKMFRRGIQYVNFAARHYLCEGGGVHTY